ncbi:MAG: SDR family NAD(P)-dependent oxidoreductase, partial [Thermoleophilaceae bacterium]
PPLEIDGSRILLTGASGGIGQAIARALHARGAELTLSGRRADALEGLATALGSRAQALPADLASTEGVRALAERTGPVDVLVANAALPGSGWLDSFSPEEIDATIDVNLRAPVQLARALAPAMVERGSGHLVFVSSMSGKVAAAGGSVYSATKFGMRGFASALRDELHGRGVGVTTVFPGFVSDAGMFAETGMKLPTGVSTRSPEQVAQAVVRGIERDRGEIDVAPLFMRTSAWLAGISPSTVSAMARRLGGHDVARELGEKQRPKRI